MLTGIVPGRIKEINGDAALPEAGGHRIIANIVNTFGSWDDDNEFCKSLDKKWPQVKFEYRRGYHAQTMFKLGLIQEINIRSDLTVVNLLSLTEDGIDNKALESCIVKLSELAKYNSSSVHFPKDKHWEHLEPLINTHLIKSGINVTLYAKE